MFRRNSPILALVSSMPLAMLVHGCTVDATSSDAGGVDAFVDGSGDANRVQIPDAGTRADVPATTCDPGLIECGGRCTRVAADAENCGSCGNACPDGVSCAVGRCDCYAPRISCDGLCSDLTDDAEHCGSCDYACPPTDFCSNGECVPMCTEANHRVCMNTDALGTRTQVCADLMNDPMNCGGCNTRCGGGSSCIAGTCTCPSGQMNCGSGCVDLSTDEANCGACRNSCGADGTCTAGACTACGTGLTSCGSPARCVDTRTSTLHCGTCGHACAGGAVCNAGTCECPAYQPDLCSSSCTDLQTSTRDCGTCGRACPTGADCNAGVCECPGAQTACGNACADLTSDPRNCGVCGRACAATFSCVSSVCDCTRTQTLCGSQCFDLHNDPAHCGTCTMNCGPGGACNNGVCGCVAGLTSCGASCLDTRIDPAHCGGCATACGAGMICRASACVAATSFRIASLAATGCRVVDHFATTGDDHGGIAITGTSVLVNGDTSTGRFDATDLGGAMAVPEHHDAMISDVHGENAYVLMTGTGGATAELVGSTSSSFMATVTQLGLLDATTGVLTSTRIPLSTPIPVATGTALLSGYEEAILGVPVGTSMRWWQIDLVTGWVTQLGNTPTPVHDSCESWGWWGIAERYGGAHYAVYVESITRIARLAIPTSGTMMPTPTTVATFSDLSDMCSITFSTSRNRWYFHHELDSQFGGSAETLGYCSGTFDQP
ncbi:MAG: hypothetical protein U0234_00900 [Sandaracinus sp.]